MQKNGLSQKITGKLISKLISKYVTSQPGNCIIAIHIFPSITRCKDNQIMILGQLIQYGQLIQHNIRNIHKKYAFIVW